MENIDHLVVKLRQLDQEKEKLVAVNKKELTKKRPDFDRRLAKTRPGVSGNLLQMVLIIMAGIVVMMACWILNLG